MRVCIMVGNNCTVDSRILRQAETFARAGHEVQIVAVHRGDVPAVEPREGFTIRRVRGNYTWREGYPRLAKLFGVKAPPPVDEAATTALPQRARTPQMPPLEAAPAGPPPPPRARLSAAGWIAWVRTGQGDGPRSWDGGDASFPARLWLLVSMPFAALPRLYRRFKRKGGKFLRRLWVKTFRILNRGRRWFLKRFLYPTRFRQLDRRIAAEAVAFRADLYWGNDVQMIRPAFAAARATGGRCVYDAHEVIWDAPTVPSHQQKLWGWVERVHMKRFDRLFTVCDPIAREMAERYDVAPPTVVMNCPRLDATSSAPAPEDSPMNSVRRPGERLVLFHGSLSVHRGLEQLVAAMALLPDEFRLVVLGYGPFRKGMEDLVVAQGLTDRVTFLEPVTPAELPAWLTGADVGMIPYQRLGRNHEYSTPNKLFEYMHTGVPVVVNDLPEIRRIVTEVGYGIIADCSDPAAIAKAIQEMVADPERYAQMRANARAAASRYSWEAQEPLILSALER